MISYYSTEQEAKDSICDTSLGYCPIIREICRTDCVCYQKSNIKESVAISKEKYIVYEPCCTHVLIYGYIEHS